MTALPQGPGAAGAAQRSPVHALTSLRFFAALAVLWFHSGSSVLMDSGRVPAPLLNIVRNGYLGVSFFFVLSGFILAYVYAGQMHRPGALKRFYFARFARVYPVYLLTVLAMLPFVSCRSLFNCLPQFLLLQMWPTLQAGQFENWNGPAWTLSVELLFYFMFPLLLRGLARLTLTGLAGTAALLAGLMLAGRLPGISAIDNVPFAFLTHVPLPVLRLPEFAFGIVMALLFLRGALPRPAGWLPHASIVLTLAIMAASQSPWVAPLAAISFGLVIFLVTAALREGYLARFLSSGLMLLLGGASYSFYLLQTPLHSWLHAGMTGPLEWAGRLVYQPLLLVLAIAMFWFIEEPVRRLLKAAGKTSLPPVRNVPAPDRGTR